MKILKRSIEHYRMGFYVAFCTLSVWSITNTPIGEYVLRSKRYMIVKPNNTTSDHEAALKDQIGNIMKDNSENY